MDPTDDEFNPGDVPAFPTVHVRVLTAEDGTVTGQVDGHPVDVDPDKPTKTLIAEAARRAAARPLRAVRVSATDAEDMTWRMVVHADGRTWDLGDLTEGKDRGRLSTRTMAGIAAGTLALTVAGLGSAWAISAGQDTARPPAPKAAPAGEAPVVPAQGWARRAGWVSPTLTDDSGEERDLLLTDAGVITTLAKDGGSLAALRESDGATLWTKPLPNNLTGQPQLTSYRGREAVAATTKNSLTVWPATESAPQSTTWEFTEADMKPVENTPVPLMASEETSTALVLHGKQLKKRILPAGAKPMTADDEGRVVAADDDGRWWRLSDDTTAPRPTQLQPPTFGAMPTEVLGMAGRTLLVAWEDDTGTLVAGYATENSMEPVWHKRVEDSPRASDVQVAPNGAWALIGQNAVQTEDGALRKLPDDWQTTGITNEAAWSKDHMIPRYGTPKNLRDPIEDDQGIPLATTKDHGLIVAEDTKGPHIYALENDPGTHYDAGEPVPPSKKPKPAETTPSSKKKPTATSKAASPAKKRSTPQKETAPTTKSWKTR